MSDEQKRDDDDDAIEGSALGGRLRIPVSRSDVGPHIKWVILSFAASLFLIAAAFAWSLIQ